jgi:tetratricopeptide (TPR) repeat protein
LSGQYKEALSNYDEMEKAGSALGDGALRLAALIERAKLYLVPNPNRDPARGKALTTQALAVARELNDRPAQAKILWNLMLSYLYACGDLEEAAGYGEQSLALARELHLREQTAFTMNDLAVVYSHYGDIRRGKVLVEESRGLWRELGNLPMLTDNLGNMAIFYYFQGDYDQAIRFYDEGFQLSQTIGNLWGEAHSRFLIGEVFLERGEWGKAVEIMEAAIRAGEQAGNPGVQIGTRAGLAWAYGSMGAIRRGIELAQLAQRFAHGEFEVLRVWPLAVLARLYLLEGKVDEAEEAIKQGQNGLLLGSLLSPMLLALANGERALARGDYPGAIRIMDELRAYLKKVSNRPFDVDALNLYAQALLGQGRGDEALEILKRARGEAEALSSRRMLWQILALSGDIESQRGDEAEAQELRKQVREIVSFIADLIPPELRGSFLTLPRVQTLINEFGQRA